MMSQTEINFLLWAIGILLGILAFIGALSVKALLDMGKDINEIKVSLSEIITRQESQDEKHHDLKERVEKLEAKLDEL